MKTLPLSLIALLTSGLAIVLSSCGKQSTDAPPSAPSTSQSAPAPQNALKLTFAYGSEKEKWISTLTSEFNAARNKIGDGRVISVEALPMGSGECIQEAMEGKRQVHLVSPASGAFITLGNAQYSARSGKDLVASTRNLVLSPVVIAMWKPMAEAIGWGKKPVGWKDIYAMAGQPTGWAGKGFPQWGAFRFGHTHPEYSNSGLISVIAELYAATGKRTGLTLQDVALPQSASFLHAIEGSVVHYGESTGFFGRKMFTGGPAYLSAAVLYENMVIEAASDPALPLPVVAIYPTEGTFWSDHPAGIVERDYVTPAHREAAEKYLDFLTATAQQKRALEFGFRPADSSIPLGAPFDAAHGVDPKEPQTTLEVPPAPVIEAALKLWKQEKKSAHIVVVLDCSGSMNEEHKMAQAKQGALEMLKLLGDEDSITLLPFNQAVTHAFDDQPLASARARVEAGVGGLFANGGTALYDAIAEAHNLLRKSDDRKRITSIVVLTDGADTNSKTITLEALRKQIEFNEENAAIRIFTIGYGKEARGDILKDIAERTRAKFFQGTPENIGKVFREISTFF